MPKSMYPILPYNRLAPSRAFDAKIDELAEQCSSRTALIFAARYEDQLLDLM